MKVVIPRTSCREKFFGPPEANNGDLMKPFEMGTDLDMLSKFSKACSHPRS